MGSRTSDEASGQSPAMSSDQILSSMDYELFKVWKAGRKRDLQRMGLWKHHILKSSHSLGSIGSAISPVDPEFGRTTATTARYLWVKNEEGNYSCKVSADHEQVWETNDLIACSYLLDRLTRETILNLQLETDDVSAHTVWTRVTAAFERDPLAQVEEAFETYLSLSPATAGDLFSFATALKRVLLNLDSLDAPVPYLVWIGRLIRRLDELQEKDKQTVEYVLNLVINQGQVIAASLKAQA
ncbi:hypothetical protein DFJ73DRAFT_837705, partial [Zopfochytrium polystomum]